MVRARTAAYEGGGGEGVRRIEDQSIPRTSTRIEIFPYTTIAYRLVRAIEVPYNPSVDWVKGRVNNGREAFDRSCSQAREA
jgi:hypothetical protein